MIGLQKFDNPAVSFQLLKKMALMGVTEGERRNGLLPQPSCRHDKEKFPPENSKIKN